MEQPKDLQLEINSKEGALWKQTAMMTQQKIDIDKIQSELNKVVLDYCNEKVLEDRKALEKKK